MLERDGRERLAGRPRVRALVLRRQRLAAPEQRVAAERDDDAHHALPSVATITALIVCMRFSASSKTSDAGGLEDLLGHLERVEAELLVDLLADLRCPCCGRPAGSA